MKKKIYILLTAALAVLAGCIHDKQWETPAADADADAGSVTLNIALPAPVVQDMGRTRGVSDFDNFKNINIILAAGAAETSTILHTIYVELDNAATTLPAGIEYSLRGGNYGLHFSKEWFRNSGMDPAGITFIVVANYGSQISEPTVGALRSHKYVSPEPGSPGNNVMYGESDIYEGNTPVHTNPDLDHAGGRTLKVDLTRLAAMITVKIDGSGLASNVEITPKSIALHNTPTWSYLKNENIYTKDGGEWKPEGEKLPVDTPGAFGGNWGVSVGNSNRQSPVGTSVRTSAGVHYTDTEAGGTPTAPNYAVGGMVIPALFMLENTHGGDGFGDPDVNPPGYGNGYGKRPAGVANNETAIDEDPRTKTCSYLEVVADYLEYGTGDNSSNVVKGGEIKYRVFLGGLNATNFDVIRNTYYRYTLMLSGTGIKEGDASWRLDTDLSNTSVLDESDFTLNAAGEMIFINELITKLNANMGIFYEGATEVGVNGSVYSYIVSTADGGWAPFPTNQSQMYNGQTYAVVDPTNSARSQFRIYVEPMTANDGVEPNKGYMRKITFYFGTNSSHYSSENITITQYGPIVIPVDPATISDDIKDQITAIGKDPTRPLTIYFDRIDRPALPWGFVGISITNSTSGTANGLALLNMLAEGSVANTYMPLGKPSAVMHAAFINAYQTTSAPDYFTNNTQWNPIPDIDDIIEAAEGTTNPIVPNSIPSSAEWKLLEMLDEAGFEVFDKAHEHDIISWQSYWTSDAVGGSTTQSVAYRRNATATDGFVNVDRTSPMPYRMIYIEQ